MNKKKFEIVVIGGGPAGSLTALQLARLGFDVCVIEQKNFPRGTLCGEFISKEVTDTLSQLDLLEKFKSLNPNEIDSFCFINDDGNRISQKLPFKGYGLKRSTLDLFLLDEAKAAGALVIQPAKVVSIDKGDEKHSVQVSQTNPRLNFNLEASIVIGAYGKRSVVDSKLQRSFTNQSSKLNGIKFHIDINHFKNFDKNSIIIFAGNGFYCGINLVNDNQVTICYLIDSNINPGSPQNELIQFIESNRTFRELFTTDFRKAIIEAEVFGAGNIHFGKKELVKNGVFMIGDSAGVIAPLAGDGMAMAAESSILISNLLNEGRENKLSLHSTQSKYIKEWQKLFAGRLKNAKLIQNIIFNEFGRKIGSRIISIYPGILSHMIKATRNL